VITVFLRSLTQHWVANSSLSLSLAMMAMGRGAVRHKKVGVITIAQNSTQPAARYACERNSERCIDLFLSPEDIAQELSAIAHAASSVQ